MPSRIQIGKHLWQAVWMALSAATFIFLKTFPSPAAERVSVTFLSVYLDAETKKADEKLRDFLASRASLEFDTRDMEYRVAIQTLRRWDAGENGPLLARVTPYVYVVAQMLGAELEVLATYRSRRTGTTTYRSYLVVSDSMNLERADLDSFIRALRGRETPARFVYHDRFSTSSYFLPSLYFRANGIFSVKPGTYGGGKFIAINSSKPPEATSSSDLVRIVKEGRADFAAVWDATKERFENEGGIKFLPLPYTVPNDLLVFSGGADSKLKNAVRQALGSMEESGIGVGDFGQWVDFNRAPEARKALALLRWLARPPPYPVTVKIRTGSKGEPSSDMEEYLEACRQGIRFSGTEFVLYDEDYHGVVDVLWTVKKSHDDSIIITSEFLGCGLKQNFYVSFKKGDMENLASQVGEIIRRHMHRIRYVWGFDDEHPTVLRDIEFLVSPGTVLKAQKITWSDIARNEFVIGTPFDAKVISSDFHSIQLLGDGFPKREGGGGGYDFDPMGNEVFRVYLLRGKERGLVFQVLVALLVVCFLLAAAFALLAAVRGKGTAGAA